MRTEILRYLSAVLGATLCLSFLPVSAQSAQAGNAPGQQGAPRPPGQNPNGMHIYLRAGLKSHGPGLHDYPQFLADWSKILTEHGAVVDGSLHAPSAAELAHTDVLVIYKGDAGYMTDGARNALQALRNPG